MAVNDSSSSRSPELRGTDWRLVALGDQPVAPADSQRAARVVLQPNSKQVAGSGGCNRLFGVYELNGDALRFSGVGSTKMACRTGMDTEAAFLSTLLHVARWRIDGQQLAMSDSSGAVLARFEATPK
jgi:putative lipoprotein